MRTETTNSENGLLTVEEFERLPEEEGRSELVRGRVVREPPAGFGRGDLASRIDRRLGGFVEEHGLGRVVTAETGWVVDPATETITEWRSRTEIRLLGRDDELESGELLPGFRLPVAELFG